MKRRTPMRRVSDRKREEIAELAALRPVIAERAGGGCEAAIPAVCVGRGDSAHHVIRRSQGGPNTAENLLWVCRPCHSHIHANPARAYSLGLLARSAAGALASPTAKGTARVLPLDRVSAERPAAVSSRIGSLPSRVDSLDGADDSPRSVTDTPAVGSIAT